MQITRLVSTSVLLAIVFAGSSFGQVKKGLNELNLSANLDVLSVGGQSSTSFEVGTSYGHFVTKGLELGAGFSLIKFEGFDVFGTFSGFVSGHFPATPESRVIPFFGGGLGFGYGDPVDNPFIFGAFGGFKFFVATGGAITVQAFEQRFQYENGGINDFGFSTGVSIFF